MILQLLASVGVGKDGEAAAIDWCPGCELAEAIGRNGQLAAAARMRSHRSQVKVANLGTDDRVRAIRKCPGGLDLWRVEVDVRVEIADFHHPDHSGIRL